MAIDKAHIGKKLTPIAVDVEKGQLKFFAKAIGEQNLLYLDEGVAKERGHPGIPAPPTFGFSLSLARPEPFQHYVEMGIDLNKVLHGEQAFHYYSPIYAGDTITLQDTITDIYSKKDGAMEFVVMETVARNQRQEDVVRMTSTIIVRNV